MGGSLGLTGLNLRTLLLIGKELAQIGLVLIIELLKICGLVGGLRHAHGGGC